MDHSNYLVKVDEFRHISVSEDGIVHLAWDRVTVHLEEEEIHLLAQTLQEETPEELPPVGDPGLMADAGPQAEWDGFEETVQLWLGDIALMLNMYDFQIFMDMVLEAALMLEVEEYLDESDILESSFPAWFMGKDDMLFSLN